MKDEIDLSGCTAFEQVRAILDDWIDYYNNDRYQWQLQNYLQMNFTRTSLQAFYPLQGKPPVHDE
jgi:transposase InsO family protein